MSDDDDKVVSLDAFRSARMEKHVLAMMGTITHFDFVSKPDERVGTSENEVLFILEGQGLAFTLADAKALGVVLIEAAAFVELQKKGIIATPD